MTWGDGKGTLVCELCGHVNEPEETVWFQGEVAICKDEAACKKRESITNILDNPDPRLDKARQLVLDSYNQNVLEVGDKLHISEVHVVWFAKVLQNWKAVVTTERSKNSGLYFEVTYNGDLKEAYLDTYIKVSNSVIPDTGPIETTLDHVSRTPEQKR